MYEAAATIGGLQGISALQHHEKRLVSLENRITMLERTRQQGQTHDTQMLALREAAARAQTVPPDFVSRRSDFEAISDMGTFIRRLLSPEDLGYAVTAEVRALARKALGLP